MNNKIHIVVPGTVEHVQKDAHCFNDLKRAVRNRNKLLNMLFFVIFSSASKVFLRGKSG